MLWDSFARGDLGARWERKAARHLLKNGYRLVAKNFRCRLGELDLVMESPNGTLVIVEVRRRKDTRISAAASVDPHKQRRIAAAAARFLAENPRWGTHAVRFDVIAIDGEHGSETMEWIQNAFYVESGSGY